MGSPSSRRVYADTLRKTPPDSPHWLNEIKLDGFRMLARIDKGHASLISRHNLDWTGRRSLNTACRNSPASVPLKEFVCC